jgi:cytoskeletal protein RodZ
MSDDRPRWSITWLLRIQRTGRQRRKPRPTASGNGSGGTGFQWFSWSVLAFLVIEVAILVWQGFLPR